MKMNRSMLIVLSILLVFTCCACSNALPEETYGKLNRMAKNEYSVIRIAASVTAGDTTLHSSFYVRNEEGKTLLDYTYEHLALFEEGKIPEDRIVTVSGTAVVKDGELVSLNDSTGFTDQIPVNLSGLCFEGRNFKDAKLEGTDFTASVADPATFTGNVLSAATDMKVSVKFSEDAFENLFVTYTSANGSAVSVSYTFEK